MCKDTDKNTDKWGDPLIDYDEMQKLAAKMRRKQEKDKKAQE